jgi:hypothetical protein
MKTLQVGAALIGIVLVGLGVAMAVTNPGQAAYEAYATDRLTEYLQDNACEQASEFLRSQCDALLEDNQDQIQQIVSENTQRQNFVILSFYTTNLSLERYLPPFLSELLPAYTAQTVGVFQNFYTYQIEQQ